MRVLSGTATALTCVGAVLALGAASASAAGPEPQVFGPSFVYDDDYAEVLTKVTVHATGRSTGVTLEASNFPRSAHGRTFGAHVHVDRCGPKPTDAGKHYQNSRTGPLRDRELWLDFTVDRDGRAYVHTERPWPVKAGTANSVVVHSKPTAADGTAGDPILCTTVPFHGTGDVKDAKDAKDRAGKPEKKAKKARKAGKAKKAEKVEKVEKSGNPGNAGKADGKKAETERKAAGRSGEEAPPAHSSPEPKAEEKHGREGPDHGKREEREEHDGRGRHDDRDDHGHDHGHGHQADGHQADGHYEDTPWSYAYHPFIEWKPARTTARR